MKRILIVLIGAGVLLGGVFGYTLFRQNAISQYLANRPEPTTPVTATEAEAQTWPRFIPATGWLTAVNGVDVSAEVAGRIGELNFKSGYFVAAGDTLVKLDAEVEKAEVRSAQAEVRLNELTAERYRKLRKTDAASQARLDEAEANLSIARANVAKLRATIDKKEIKAPFDGVLGIRGVDLGEYVQPGQKIVTIQDLSSMLLDFSVPQQYLAVISTGQEVQMTVESYPDRVFKGKLTALDPKVDLQSGLIQVQASFSNESGLLRPGMFAKVDIALPAEENQIVVPQTAVSYSLYGDFVYVVKADENGDLRAQQTVVEVKDRRKNRAVLASGVAAGDKVITTGSVRLSNGAKVQIVEDSLSGASASDAAE
ncbi:efflux RND transporter periplasmic adaptor subunit [Aestuariispira ectoiniformans]|uniref:efflux RND transporter periplasmic adaptor subunit n=1 Tax=Aestuariispira ectoiniformans TaxID=2775080 RepID=UPI00223AB735|nr:efflux RND transporter periplasmic adaptor subunit [Aestuariispira ectoiniformans]